MNRTVLLLCASFLAGYVLAGGLLGELNEDAIGLVAAAFVGAFLYGVAYQFFMHFNSHRVDKKKRCESKKN
ncbi:MAG: hypothetical protein KF886_03745 [Candidatus Hydrogenedentes bacterium]|nr:hypothetical protein [Candidatus Hydrogenedentota bacterium]